MLKTEMPNRDPAYLLSRRVDVAKRIAELLCGAAGVSVPPIFADSASALWMMNERIATYGRGRDEFVDGVALRTMCLAWIERMGGNVDEAMRVGTMPGIV